MDNPTITVTQLSKYLGISPRQIQMYVAQGVLPKKAKGRYNRNACMSAYLAHKVYFGPQTFTGRNDPEAAQYALDRFEYQREERAEYEAQIAKLEAKITRLEAKIEAGKHTTSQS